KIAITSNDYPFYRIRKSPEDPADPLEYDSPPEDSLGKGRLDSSGHPVFYASPDLEICVHECRVTAEDELYVATLKPNKSLRLLNLAAILKEDRSVTEFESLDLAVHMLFVAGDHAFEFTRAISSAAHSAGFDGIVYPSYFSLVRHGAMPFQAVVYGISNRRIPEFQKHEESVVVQNLALFGRPIREGKIAVSCINKLTVTRTSYSFLFGPVVSR
ncbi:MAG TPA: RES family NAD+ phosphorylase, partial [Rhizomicrobium sp.]|nr:RES family NAD+ phosphorylase [Rhizomicrobium sp.]